MSAMDTTGVKRFLRRTKNAVELEQLAVSVFASATDEVTITSISTEGSSSAGQITFPKLQLLNIIEELLEEGTNPRQFADQIDRSWCSSPV